MTDMRKLVAGLSRILGTKHHVVARLLKQSADKGGSIEAYMGDVEDHILLLQNSLYHYEAMLSQCQPSYMSNLRVSALWARAGTDIKILALSTVTISVLPMQVLVGMFSLNIHLPSYNLPHNVVHDYVAPFWIFVGIVFGVIFIGCVMVGLIRWWRWQARVKKARERRRELPSLWDGFWGWR